MFRSVTQDKENVYLTLADGTVITLSKINTAGNIQFEDSLVKALCIANWDTNYDGELSYAEAAAVTALGEVFRGTKIRSFNELTYFTGLTAIDDRAFYECSELCSVAYPVSVTTIGKEAFKRTGLINIIIPETIKVIEDAAFAICEQVQRIDLRYPVTIQKDVFAFTTGKVYLNCNLPDYAYSDGGFDWSNISKLVVGDNVEVIGDQAFTECRYLSEVEFAPKGKLHTIGIGNFFRSAITTLNIPESLPTWGDYAFVECNSLKTTTGGSKHFQVMGNVLMYITGSDNKIILYPPGRNDETYTIPGVIKVIGNSAFRKCNNLKAVVFPDRSYFGYEVSEIGEMAFYSCKNLVSVPNFEKNRVTSVPRSAFSGCENLESITLPPTIETIAESAFHSCSSLTSINIPDGVTGIGENAFHNCNLATIYCKAQTPPAIQYNSFDCWEQCTLYVPVGCKEAYAAAEYWQNAKEIIEMEF